MTNKIAIFLGTGFTVFALLVAGYSLYSKGKSVARLECSKEKQEVQVKTVEIIKYITKEDAKIYVKPNSDFATILKRMKKDEI